MNERNLDAWRRHLGRDFEPDALLRELTEGSLPEAFHATAAAVPERRALQIDGSARTHGELDQAAGRFAGMLRERGIQPGDPLLLSSSSSIEMVEGYLGALRAGATVVLANPTYTEAELRHLAEDSGAVAALAAGPVTEPLARLASELPRLKWLLELGATDLGDARPLPLEAVPGDRPALLAYTSGTTGKPKAVPLTHSNLLSSIRAVMLAWRWSADDVLAHSLPLFHQHGLGGVHATLIAGSRAVIAGKFEPAPLCETIRTEGASVLFAVPAIYERLVAHEGIETAELDSLRLLVSGSAPLSPGLAERVERLAGQRPLERYGTTESGLDVSDLYDGRRRPGYVGLPLPGVELEVVDDDGAPVPEGENGEIVLRGPQVFGGYRSAVSESSFHRGGWFRTGDIGRIDRDDGYLAITGRAKDIIITGGMNVYPREVELALEQSDLVERAAVVGLPSGRWGEEVVAAVVPATGPALAVDAVLAFARERLAPYKRPKRIVVVDALPLNEMGKVVASEVMEIVSAR